MNREKLIAVCGLVCSDCKIHKAPNNPELAKELVKYFEGQWENVKMDDFHCNGCRDLANCWNSDCWIRECCIKDKKLEYCYQCRDFPCDQLEEWAKENERYRNTLENLRKMKKVLKK